MNFTRDELIKRRAQLSPEQRARLEQRLGQMNRAVDLPPAISPRPDATDAPLSFAQQRLWFFDQLDPGNPAHHIAAAFRMTGTLNLAAMEKSLGRLVERHAILRTRFPANDGHPIQQIDPPQPYHLPLHDLRMVPGERQDDAVTAQIAALVRAPFDLVQGPTWRGVLLQLAPTEHILVLVLHHIVCDGWSWGVLMHDVVALYNAEVSGQVSPLAPLQIQYADFANWQQTGLKDTHMEPHLSYWREQLRNLPPPLALPTDRPYPSSGRATKAWIMRPIPAELHTALNQLSRSVQSTLYMTTLAALKVLLYRYTRQTDMVIGTLSANRTQPEIEPLIGIFINTLVLRTDLSGQPTLREVIQRVQKVATSAYQHQDLPVERLIDALQPTRDLHRPPLCNVLFVFQNTTLPSVELSGVQVRGVPTPRWTTEFDLTVEISEVAENCTLAVEYHTGVFETATIERFIDHYLTILQSLVAAPDQAIEGVPFMTPAEQMQMRDWNATATPLPQAPDWATWFEAQVAQTPEATAVCCGAERLTYAELNTQANRLASRLQERGVGPECVVGLLAERGIPLLTAIVGVLKAGAAYLPLDPRHPPQRLRQVIQPSQSQLVLVTEEHRALLDQALDLLPADQRPAVGDMEAFAQAGVEPAAHLTRHVGPDQLAYVIYTSGSTGQPKGAMVIQQGMLNHLAAKIADLELTAADRIVQNASQTFDISVWQFLCLLLVGGQVHIVPNEIAHDPLALLELVQAQAISVLQVVPSMLRVMLDEVQRMAEDRPALRALRWIVPTGEALPTDIAGLWLQRYPHVPIMNAYGSTECSDDQCHHPIRQLAELDHEPVVAIGRPLANTEVYILDPALQPVPVGVVGELYVGGVGVGRGYLHDAYRTSDRFIPDPFGTKPGARLYRSGDIARYRSDGVINFLGRSDHQVKIRGFRIELGEIEVALRQHPDVRETVVVVQTMPEGEPQLVSYVVLHAGATTTGAELLSFLQKNLPIYMVPAAMMLMEALPLSPNGKVDRKALPLPAEIDRPAAAAYVAPRNELETQVALAWSDVLGRSDIGINDHFFMLGGSSLVAVRLIARIQQHTGHRLPVASLFTHATIAAQSALIQSQQDRGTQLLVPIQPLGTRSPLFLIHPVGGNVLCYRLLAEALKPDQPVYGLQAPGVDGESVPEAGWTIEELAQRYIAAIRSVQPHGPYAIGGWSMGGVVAYEVAQRLSADGETIRMLTVIDAAAHYHESGDPSTQARRAARFALDLLATDLDGIGEGDNATAALVLRFARELGVTSAEDLLQIGDVDARAATTMIKRFAQAFGVQGLDDRDDLKAQITLLWEQAQTLGVLAPQQSFERIKHLFTVHEHNLQALRTYTPQTYAGPMSLIISSERAAHSDDPTCGWGPLVGGSLRTKVVPGTHYTLLTPPAVADLAASLLED
jgi:amino acid adenylation domain-containing protein